MGNREKRGAFSLVEVLISLAIMALALLVLVSVLVTGLKAQTKNERLMIADSLAERIFERTALSLPGLSKPQAEAFWESNPGTLPTNLAQGEETVGNTQFTFEISAENIMNASGSSTFGTAGGTRNNELKILQVTVRWADDTQTSGSGVGLQHTTIKRLINRRPDD